MVRYLLSALLLLCVPSVVYSQYWEWSQPAAHHDAICKVRSGPNGGSGVYIRYQELTGILTVAHIAHDLGDASATFGDGTAVTGRLTIDRYGYDLAFMPVNVEGISPLLITGRPPNAGDRLEYVTYGGPDAELRHWYATYEAREQSDAYVTHGDSGGAILNEWGQVVSVQSAGAGRPAYHAESGFHVYGGSRFASYHAVAAFIQRVESGDTPSGGFGLFRCGPGG